MKAFKKLTKKQKQILLYVALAVIAIVALALISKRVREEKEIETIVSGSESLSTGGGGSFTPKPLTDRIIKDLNAWLADRTLYVEIMQLNDDQLRDLWEDWERRYRKEYHDRQLADAIFNGYSYSRNIASDAWTKYAGPVWNRLKAIGLP